MLFLRLILTLSFGSPVSFLEGNVVGVRIRFPTE